MRATWYLLNDHVKGNDQIQRCGSINLMYMRGEFPKNMNYDLIQRGTNVFNYTPLKFVGVYALMDGERNPWSNVLDLIVFAVGRVMRMRTRAIYGTFLCMTCFVCWWVAMTEFRPEFSRDDTDLLFTIPTNIPTLILRLLSLSSSVLQDLARNVCTISCVWVLHPKMFQTNYWKAWRGKGNGFAR